MPSELSTSVRTSLRVSGSSFEAFSGTGHRAPEGFASRRSRAVFTATVVVGYLVLGVIAYWPILPGTTHRLFYQADQDPAQTVWFLAWTAHTLVTGHNPFFTTAVNVPMGFNLAQAPAMPLLGLVGLPVTLAAGPVASTTMFMVAAMPLSAASTYAVLCRWRVWAPAAALGGLAYGFSPYMVNQGLTHLDLVFVPLPPLIVAALVKALTGPRRPLLCGSALAALIVAQYFISAEVLALTAVMCAVGIAIVTAYCLERARDTIRIVARPVLSAFATALALTGAALAWPLWYQFAGPIHYVGPANLVNNAWFSDVLDFVAPSPRQAVAPVLRSVGTRLSVFAGAENGAYVGFALFAVLAFLVWRQRASWTVRLASGLGVISGVLSMGRYLVVDERASSVPLPFDILAHLPATDNILPIRFAFTTAACIAAVIAFGLDDLRERSSDRLAVPGRHRHAVASAFCLVSVVLVVTWLPTWPYPSQPVTVLPVAVTRVLPSGNPIILSYPYPVFPEDRAFLWQAGAQFSFRLLGVYGRVPGPDLRASTIPPLLNPPAVQEYLVAEDGLSDYYPAPPPLKQVVGQTRIFAARQDVRGVLVDLAAPHGKTVAQIFTDALGQPLVTSGQFVLWTLIPGTALRAPVNRADGGTARP